MECVEILFLYNERTRSSRPEVFSEKGVLRNFAKFTGKHLCQCLFFNKVAGLSLQPYIKKRLWHGCFPTNFAKFLRTPFVTEHLCRLLLENIPYLANRNYEQLWCKSFEVLHTLLLCNTLLPSQFSAFVS